NFLAILDHSLLELVCAYVSGLEFDSVNLIADLGSFGCRMRLEFMPRVESASEDISPGDDGHSVGCEDHHRDQQFLRMIQLFGTAARFAAPFDGARQLRKVQNSKVRLRVGQ